MSEGECPYWVRSLRERTSDYAKNLASKMVESLVEQIESGCESPIECLLASELVLPFSMYARVPYVLYECRDLENIEAACAQAYELFRQCHNRFPPEQRQCVVTFPQVTVGAYRLDFVVAHCGWVDDAFRVVKVAVECDGHDFHERTKEQAQRDRQKDRYLQSIGLTALRFTGSEIHADPGKCAWEIIGLLSRRFTDGA